MTVRAILPILTFHHISDRPSAITFPPGVFQRAMLRLHQHGYRTLSLTSLVDMLVKKEPFQPRSLVITFDDGYRSVYEQAFPVLRSFNMTATVFLTVGEKGANYPSGRLPSLNGIPMLDWSEIKEMNQEGISFGAHTQTHPDLTRLPPDSIEAELVNSKVIIEDALGVPVDSFAYPFGRYDRQSYHLVRQKFSCACTDKLGLVTAASDIYALERVDAYYLRTDRLSGLFFSKRFPWYICLRSIPRQLKRRVLSLFVGKY